MAEIFELEPPPPPKPGNPWLTMWTQPRATMRWILDNEPDRWVHLLMMTGGVIGALTRASWKNAGDEMSLGAVLGVYSVVGVIGGLITLYAGGWLLTQAGQWLGGEGSFGDVRSALAWSQVPAVWGVSLLIINLALFGEQMYTSHAPAIEANQHLAAVLAVVEIAAAVWGFVIWVKCLGEAMGVSDWLALGSIILAMCGMAVVFGVVEAVVTGVASAFM